MRYQESDRAALGFLDEMRVRVPGGQEYPFSELANYTIKRGLNAINHLDKKKEIIIRCKMNLWIQRASEILGDFYFFFRSQICSDIWSQESKRLSHLFKKISLVSF